MQYFISYEYLYKFHYLSSETGASEKSYLRAEQIYNQLTGDTDEIMTWQVFQEAYTIWLDILDYGDAYNCDLCPEPLPEGDSEENYPDIEEVHIGDGTCEGNEVIIKKGIPEDKLFGNKPPANAEVKYGVE